jgi:hypothetical protein
VLANTDTDTSQHTHSFTPDFVLVRNFVLGIHGQSWLNTLMALRYAP